MASTTIPGAIKPLVLLVEDDVSLRGALAFSLQIEGYRVEVCDTAEALLLRPPPVRPVCLVVDQRLAGISGLDALAVLRGRRVTLPAILITTQPTTSLRRRAAVIGVRIVEKPLLDAELFAAIAEELAR
jgi:two-component system, LuxR family, response regulator FixJ